MIELQPDQMTLYKKFKRCVDQFSIEKMDKKLYHFFIYECNFIAHYSIHGFRHEYSGQNFLRWFDNFANPNWMFFIPGDKYENLRKLCVQYAKEKTPIVYKHFEREERNQKVQLLHTLSRELGVAVVEQEKQESKDMSRIPTLYKEEEDGQLSLFS